jgi:glycosyltransferase involved in cell wall biosynthesis
MGFSIYESLSSVCDQLNDNFEILVVDDGSKDNSIEELIKLRKKYDNFIFYSYPRDPKRSLGTTRNLSIKHAKGKYVVLHIDADDKWDNGILEWCYKAIKISQRYNDQIYISGPQIQFVNKEFIEKFGGYRGIDYGEDRDLWARLAYTNKILFINHEVFRTRMTLPKKYKFLKIFRASWQILLFDFRCGENVVSKFFPLLKDAFLSKPKRGRLGDILRIIFILPAFFYSLFKGVLPDFRPTLSLEQSIQYKEKNTKNFDDWFKLLNIKV